MGFDALKKFLGVPLFGEGMRKADAPPATKKKKRDVYDEDENTTIAGEDTTIQPDVKKGGPGSGPHKGGGSLRDKATGASEKAKAASSEANKASAVADKTGADKDHQNASRLHAKAEKEHERAMRYHGAVADKATTNFSRDRAEERARYHGDKASEHGIISEGHDKGIRQ